MFQHVVHAVMTVY